MRPGVWLGLGLVVLAALLDLQVVLRADPGPISGEVMADAVRVLKAHQQPGDLIVHSPLFSVTELAALGELPARPDLPVPAVRSGRRILLLDRNDQPMFGFGAEAKRVELPAPLVLRIFEPTGDAAAPVYELLSSLDPNVMKVERPEGTVSAVCNRARAEGGFDCPGEAEWLYAAPRTLRIGGADRECVWAHPTTGGVIVFTLPAPNAPAPGRHLELTVEAGMTDDAVTGTADGAPVGIDIRQNQQPKGRLSVPNQVGFRTGKFRVEAALPVELRITTARDGRRHHCLNATLTEVPGP